MCQLDRPISWLRDRKLSSSHILHGGSLTPSRIEDSAGVDTYFFLVELHPHQWDMTPPRNAKGVVRSVFVLCVGYTRVSDTDTPGYTCSTRHLSAAVTKYYNIVAGACSTSFTTPKVIRSDTRILFYPTIMTLLIIRVSIPYRVYRYVSMMFLLSYT